MAIVVEDGTGSNPAANSYTDVDALKAYAKARGVSLSGKTNTDLEAALIRAMDFLESKHDQFKGYKTSTSQALQWPREDVWGVERPDQLTGNDEIPRVLEYGQLALAIDALSHDLQPTQMPSEKGRIVKEKVDGVVELTYSNEGKVRDVPAFAKADALLAPLYKKNGLRLIRA